MRYIYYSIAPDSCSSQVSFRECSYCTSFLAYQWHISYWSLIRRHMSLRYEETMYVWLIALTIDQNQLAWSHRSVAKSITCSKFYFQKFRSKRLKQIQVIAMHTCYLGGWGNIFKRPVLNLSEEIIPPSSVDESACEHMTRTTHKPQVNDNFFSLLPVEMELEML